VTDPIPDLSPLLPDDATLKARRAALVDAVGATKATGAASPRRRDPRLALAGAGVMAAIVAAVLVLGSGPSAESAAAEALRQTAAIAEASDSRAEAAPGPGQFLFTKTLSVELQGWLPNGPGTGPKSSPRYFTAHVPSNYPNAPAALVPTVKEVWTADDGKTHERETLGRIDFFTDADQRRWQDAGSPPPFSYDPSEHQVRRDGSGHLVKAFASQSWRGRHEFSYVSRLSRLPTEPEALRLVLEHRPAPGQPRVEVIGPTSADSPTGWSTIERLMSILSEPITTPALRAAAFNALAEIPGIELKHDVSDVAGRRGDAIAWIVERGFGREFIFDPRTSRILAQAEMIFKAKAAGYPQLPDGTVFRETAYLQSGIVEPGS
jgi:hypothetical protein